MTVCFLTLLLEVTLTWLSVDFTIQQLILHSVFLILLPCLSIHNTYTKLPSASRFHICSSHHMWSDIRGPSHDAYYELRDVKQIQMRGRWKAIESVRRYRKPGRMLLSHKEVPKSVWQRAVKARQFVIPAVVDFLKKNKTWTCT